MAEEADLIADFIGDIGLLDYHNFNMLDKVINHIQNLGYSFTLASFKSKNGKDNVVAFCNTSEPYDNITIRNSKSKLDAIYELVLKFVKDYEPREKKDN